MVDDELRRLILEFEAASPADRITFRDPILAFGTASMAPLEQSVNRRPDLMASVVAWLEKLAQKQPAANVEIEQALRRLAGNPDGRFANDALERLGQGRTKKPVKPRKTGGPPRRDVGEEVHARVVQAAKAGRLIVYSDLETNRRYMGTYLRRIVQEEADAGHPPLTAIVVSKSTRRPGDGFLPAMIEIGYAQPGETLSEVWKRAVAEVFAFWAARP